MICTQWTKEISTCTLDKDSVETKADQASTEEEVEAGIVVVLETVGEEAEVEEEVCISHFNV